VGEEEASITAIKAEDLSVIHESGSSVDSFGEDLSAIDDSCNSVGS
jgi:hypothetical protein